MSYAQQPETITSLEALARRLPLRRMDYRHGDGYRRFEFSASVPHRGLLGIREIAKIPVR
jgi:hypothetical protein